MNPDINKAPWSEDEDRTILSTHSAMGNRWAELAKFLPGKPLDFHSPFLSSFVLISFLSSFLSSILHLLSISPYLLPFPLSFLFPFLFSSLPPALTACYQQEADRTHSLAHSLCQSFNISSLLIPSDSDFRAIFQYCLPRLQKKTQFTREKNPVRHLNYSSDPDFLIPFPYHDFFLSLSVSVLLLFFLYPYTSSTSLLYLFRHSFSFVLSFSSSLSLFLFLPVAGRTDNAIKNHWNSSMRKQVEAYLKDAYGKERARPNVEDGHFTFGENRIAYLIIPFMHLQH